MINKVDNNCSFKATFDTSLKVANKSRLKNIEKLFKDATKNYPNEKLYLTNSEDGNLMLRTSLQKDGFYPEEISTENINEFLDNFSDKEISRKLLNAFKVLRLSDISTQLQKTIQYNKDKYRSNMLIAKNLRKVGRENFAEKYEMFAKFNKDKVKNLNQQLDNVKNNFFKQREIASKQLPDVMQIEII